LGQLSLKNVVKTFGQFEVVKGVNLDVTEGEFVVFVGPSGCGKSTLLRMIAGLEHTTSGDIVIDGKRVNDLPPVKRGIAMVFQSYALYPHMSVFENIAFPLRVEKAPEAVIREKVTAAAKILHLDQRLQQKPGQLSGGQRQRVALARALAKRPKLLLLDEPLGALDKKLREETQIELVNIIEKVGVTCVMVTHDQEEAMTMATRIAIMSEGRVLQVGPPADIYETPANRFVADFIGNVNLMDGSLTDDQADHCIITCTDCSHYVGHGITGTEGMAVSVAIRPEKIRLGRAEPAGPHNRVQGTVKDLSYFGALSVYHLQLASGAVLKISEMNAERHRDDRLTWGDTAWASWSDSAHVVLTQ
jgi:putrescine transport system ATP-binding protein